MSTNQYVLAVNRHRHRACSNPPQGLRRVRTELRRIWTGDFKPASGGSNEED